MYVERNLINQLVIPMLYAFYGALLFCCDREQINVLHALFATKHDTFSAVFYLNNSSIFIEKRISFETV